MMVQLQMGFKRAAVAMCCVCFGWSAAGGSEPSIAAGPTRTGVVAAWGYNEYGQCDVPPGLADVAAVTAGGYHSLALKSDGTVAVWGANWYGQCDVPAGLADVVAIAAGNGHSLALQSDGTVAAWGANWDGRCDVPAGLADVVAIAAGDSHSLALEADGTVAAWGENSYGQCDVPAGLVGVVAVAAGGFHSLALKDDGTIAAWGYNEYGQCDVPAGLADVVAVAAGGYHSLALKSDGTVVVWGQFWWDSPAGLADAVAIAAAGYHNIALKADGTVTAWGNNGYGESTVPGDLSDVVAIAAGGWHSLVIAEPKPPLITDQPESVNARSGQRVDLTTDVFSLLTCTSIWYRQGSVEPVGTGTTWCRADVQVADAGSYYLVASNALGVVTSEVAAVSVNPEAFVAILPCRYSGIPLAGTPLRLTANVWGEEPMTFIWYINGQQAHVSATPEWALLALTPEYAGTCQLVVSNAYGTVTSRSFDLAPVQPGLVVAWGTRGVKSGVSAGLENVVAVAVGGGHSLALKADGTVAAWGWNGEGQRDVPTGLADVVAVAAGAGHSLALKADGTVVAWGGNWQGQCDVPAGLADVVAVSAGEDHSLALKADGTIVAWGVNWQGQCDVPAGLADVVAVSAGADHNLALRADGTVAAWGDNSYGQCDVPAGLADVVAVSAGADHNLALKADGTVVAWGRNLVGQCDVPAGLDQVIAVSGRGDHNLALKADGTVAAWGANWDGQCDIPPFCSPSLDIAAGWFQSLAIIPDTDGDGAADSVELDLGRDPDDPADGGAAVTATGRVSSPCGPIAGARVTLRGASGWIYHRTTTDANGNCTVEEMITGHYRIKVEADGFADRWYEGAEHEDGAQPCALAGASPVAIPDFLLIPGQSPALVQVTSDPPGAAIYLDYQPTGEVTPAMIDVGEIGSTDAQGNRLASHVITLKRAGSPRPTPRTITPVEAETTVENFDLTGEEAGAILVETTPAGAEVFVDCADEALGVTPLLVENLAAGMHTVLLRKEGCLRPRPITANVKTGEAVVASYAPNSFNSTGTAQEWHSDDNFWEVALPFAFPFYGVVRTNLFVNSNGTLTFDEPFDEFWPSVYELRDRAMIAVLWNDLSTEAPGDIKVSSGDDFLTVVWECGYSGNAVGDPVNASATLHANGRIELKYGQGNTFGGMIGVSAGDDMRYTMSLRSQSGSMELADDIVFDPAATPPPTLVQVPLTPESTGPEISAAVESPLVPDMVVCVDYLPTEQVTDAVVMGLDPAWYSASSSDGFSVASWHTASHTILLRKAGVRHFAPRYVDESATNTVQTLVAMPWMSYITLDEALDTKDTAYPPTWATGPLEARWTGVGEVEGNGEDAAVSGAIDHGQSSWLVMSVTNGGTLTFKWRVSCQSRYDYLLLVVDGVAQGRISGESGWLTKTLEIAGEGPHEIVWNYIKDGSVTGGLDRAWVDRVVWISEPLTLGVALDNTNLVWQTWGDAPWMPMTDESGVNKNLARSGSIGDYGVSALTTTVTGPGLFSFRWRSSCQSFMDWLDFVVDGGLFYTLTGESGGQDDDVFVELGPGIHTLSWEYWKNEAGASGEDAGYLDFVGWWPANADATHTSTTPVPVPYTWLDGYPGLLDAFGGDYEAAALSASGKRDAAGNPLAVWRDYVAGTCPTNPASLFRCFIEMEGGSPILTWDPDLGNERVYTIWGRESLGSGDWITPTNAASRFFRVGVSLP